MKVTTPPLLKVEVNVEVISGGANEVVCPLLLVVWMKTVLENVVEGPEGVVLEVVALLLGLEELVESTEEVVEVGRGVEDDDEGLLEGTTLAEVMGDALAGELLGDGLEDEGGRVEETGEELVGAALEGGEEDGCGEGKADVARVDPV